MQIYFAWKQLNVDYSKNISKEENRWHSFVWLCLATYQQIKVIENCNSVGTGAHKLGKVATFCPTLTLIFPIFREAEKGKLYTLKKAGLSTFKEML